MGALFKIFKSDGITEITNIKSVIYREAVNTGEHLRPGCVCSASVDVEVFNTQANAVSAGDVIYAYVYDNANNGTLLGKFNCEPKIDTKKSYRFTAYDNALKLNADFSQWLQANQSSFPMTVNQLVQQACTIAGVTLGTATWPLSAQNVQAFYADGLTCRDILSYAAELSGKFVRCHTDGKIYIEWYTYSANSIAPSAGTGIYAYKQDGLTYANYTTTSLARVAVHPSGEDDVAYVYPTDRPSGNTLHIKNNLLLTGADAALYNAAAQQVYFAIRPISQYSPTSVSLFPRENPFRAGDIVSITDAQGVTFSAPVTSMMLSNAAATLLSEGRENYEDTTETAKAIAQLASDIVRINKLKVDWADINQAIVNYLRANQITAQDVHIIDDHYVSYAYFNGGSGLVITKEPTVSALYLNNDLLSLSHGADGDIVRFDATGTDPTFVIGQFTSGLTKGKWSVTTGFNNAATGDYSSTVGGSSNRATGNGSVVIGGSGNTAQDTDQVVFGHYNDAQNGYAEIVGNGVDYNNRSNARTLDWSGNEVLAGGLTTGDDVAVTGDISAAGGLNLGSYFTRKLPTLVADTTYLGTRFEDENGNGRGGLGFYYVTQHGEGVRLYTTRGGVNNGVAMYIDANGNSSVVFGQPDAWRAGLNVSANYAAGDTISFPSTGNSYFTRFHGDWRDTKNLYFFIPTSRSCVGLTATVSGLIYLVTNGVRNSVNMSNVTPTCFCTDGGIAVRLQWSTAPSYAVQYNLASVQPYGFTVTFS